MQITQIYQFQPRIFPGEKGQLWDKHTRASMLENARNQKILSGVKAFHWRISRMAQLESLTSNTAHGMTSQMVCVISKVFCFAWVMGGISHLCQNGGVDLLLKWGVVGWVRARGVGGSSSLTSPCIVNLQNNCVHYGEGGISSLIIFPCIVRLQIASIIHVSCSPLGINISCSKLMTNWNGDIESNIVYCRVNIRFLLSIFLIWKW